MSSKQQYKEYNIRLKKQNAKLISTIEELQKKLTKVLFPITNVKKESWWTKYKFLVGFLLGIALVEAIECLYIVLIMK